ncbi:MAG: tetraacyldisaccharide 4'-kinase [Phycisphaeraceae bacterium]
MSGASRGVGPAAVRAALAAAEPAYAGAVRVRNALYDRGWRRVVRLGRPTVSVGNVTAGGTGKTPMVIELCRRLAGDGAGSPCRPAVLMRGYGGDESREVAETLGDAAAMEVNVDRAAAARAVLRRDPRVGVFVLDDGFQHRRVHRDLDLVLVDATQPFGYNHVLPRGLLREPVAGLRRASAVIVTRAEAVSDVHLAALDERIEAITSRPAAAHAAYEWAALRDGDEQRSVADLAGRRVAGVCGVGNPAAFERALRQAVGEHGSVVFCAAGADHQAYTREAVRGLGARARAAGAELVVTTGKDWVKWRDTLGGEPAPLPVWRAEVAVRFVRGEAAVDAMLAGVVARDGSEAGGSGGVG